MTKRIALVSCVKSKRQKAAPARDLYTSALFRGLRQYAEIHSDLWYILSAQYGVLSPDQIVEPYERTLLKMRRTEQLAWAHRVQGQLSELIVPGSQIIILAGKYYRRDLMPFFQSRGCTVTIPLDGLRMGEQLKCLKAMFP